MIGHPSWGRIVKRVLFAALGTASWLSVVQSVAARDQSPLAKRVLKEAPPAWAQQGEFFLTLDFVNRAESRFQNEKGKWTSKRIRASSKSYKNYVLNGQEEFTTGQWRGHLSGYNSEYKFVLVRDDETRPWAIQSVAKRDEASIQQSAGLKPQFPGLVLGADIPSLPWLVKKPGFSIVRVEPESTKGEELMRVTFTARPKDSNGLKQGWVVLDPNRYWVVRKCEVECDLGKKKEGKFVWTHQLEYRDGSNGHPIATKALMRGEAWQKGRLMYVQEYHNEYEVRERPNIPESEFKLTHFGLPEPFDLPRNRSPWFLWFGIAGVACLVLAAGVRFFKRRLTAT